MPGARRAPARSDPAAAQDWGPWLTRAARTLGAGQVLLYLPGADRPVNAAGPPRDSWPEADGPCRAAPAGVESRDAWVYPFPLSGVGPALLVALDSPPLSADPDRWADVAAQAEEHAELLELRQRHRQTFEDHGAVKLLIDPTALEIVEANSAAAHLYGFTREQLAGMPLTRLSAVPPDRIAENARRILSGERRWFRVRHRTAAGEERTLDVHSSPVTVRGRSLLLSILQDVTEQERAVETLRATQARLSALLLNLPSVAFYETGGGREFLSDNIEGLIGYSAAELAADRRLFPSLIHPDDRPELNERVRAWHAAGEPGPLINTFRIRHREGRWVWLEDHMVEIYPPEGARFMSGVLIDVSERRRAETDLRESREALARNEAHFRTLIENALDLITVLEPDGTIVYESPSVERVLGYGPGELLGRNAFELVHPDDQAEVQAAHGERLEEPPNLAGSQEFRVRHRDGRWLVFEAMAQPLETPEGPRLIVNSRDITERRLLEEQLRHALKMEAVGRLSGAVAHDFNNLLAVIHGYTQLLLDREQEPVNRECLQEVSQAAERAIRLTRQLLAFSRRQVVQRVPLDLNEVVRGMEAMLRRLAGDVVELTLDLDPLGAPVVADPGQLEQVLMNLVINARDAMPEGGAVQVRTRTPPVEDTQTAAQSVGHEGAFVLLTVSDTGSGMDAATRSRIFEPFFTTKDQGKGTGLGLATVYTIVQQSGGLIRVSSDPGLGATFSVFLPRCAAPAQPEPPSGEAAAPGGTETILVAEDEEQVRRMIAGILSGRGYTVLDCGSGREALDRAARHSGRIDLLLTDVLMPGMRGPELAALVQQARPGLPVLYISGHADDEELRGRIQDRTADFLAKPFSPDELARKVRALLD
jgi:two-component system cell cycle sensor histidine kinase/response regulator CckA